MDLATRERWTVNINDGPLPLWLLDAKRRPLGTKATDFLGMVKLLLPTKKAMGEVIDCSGPAYDRFLQPLMLAALNTDPKEGAASLAGQIIRETIMRGGKYVRPLIAHEGLGHALVEPALAYLASRNATVRFGDRMRALEVANPNVAALPPGERQAAPQLRPLTNSSSAPS